MLEGVKGWEIEAPRFLSLASPSGTPTSSRAPQSAHLCCPGSYRRVRTQEASPLIRSQGEGLFWWAKAAMVGARWALWPAPLGLPTPRDLSTPSMSPKQLSQATAPLPEPWGQTVPRVDKATPARRVCVGAGGRRRGKVAGGWRSSAGVWVCGFQVAEKMWRTRVTLMEALSASWALCHLILTAAPCVAVILAHG